MVISRAMVAAGLLTAAGVALAIGVTAPAQANPAAPTVTSSARTITLINGQQVRLTPTGGYQVNASARSEPLLSYVGANGDHYLVPDRLLPDLGKTLDTSLFDTTALATMPATASIPVQLTFAPGTRPTAPPGITLYSVHGSTATGDLNTTDAPAFTASLHYRTGLTKVALAGATIPATAKPY